MQLTTDGIVIKEKKFNDDDRIITVLTRQYGLINAYAKDATKLKSKLANSTELLCYSRLFCLRIKTGT
jgi:DNA repair protein RecO (recombination protein O)